MIVDKSIVLQLVSFIFLFFYFFNSKIKKTNWLQAIVTLSLLILLVSCVFLDRNYHEVTIDLKAYMNYYKHTVIFYDVFNSTSSWKGDYFFFMIMPIAHFLNFNPETYISFQTLISISLLFLGYYRFYKTSKGLAVLGLFFVINSSSFYLTQGNVLRQGMASSFLILSLTAKSNFKWYAYKVLAFFTHRGSMFSFLTFLVPKKKTQRGFLLLLALFFGFFSIHFFIFNLLPLPELFKSKIEFYTNFVRASNNSLFKLFILLFFNSIFLFYGNLEETRYRNAYNLFFVFSFFAMLLFRLDGVFSRLILFTDILCPILTIGMLTKIENIKYKAIALCFIIILSMIYSTYVFNHSSILFNLGEETRFF